MPREVIWRLHTNCLESGRITVFGDGDSIDGICVGSKPIENKSGQCWSYFSCRRRGFSCKLTPIIFQAVLITVIWFVVKKTCVDLGKDVTMRGIGSSDVQRASMSICNQGELGKGSSLLLKDIIAVSGSQENGDQQNRYFLQVDILVRKEDQATPTLYTVGTPVIVNDLFTNNGEDDPDEYEVSNDNMLSEKEKAEFYYDNSVVEEKEEDDEDGFANDQVGEVKGIGQGAPWQIDMKGTADVIGVKENVKGDLQGRLIGNEVDFTPKPGQVTNRVVGGGQAIQNANPSNEHDNTGQIISDTNSYAMKPGQNFNLKQQNFQQNQVGVSSVQNQNNLQVQQPELQFQNQQNRIPQQMGVFSQIGVNANTNRQGNLGNQQDNSNIAMGQQRPLLNSNMLPVSGQRAYNVVGNADPEKMPLGNNGAVDVGQAQGMPQARNLHHKGFKERLIRFKTEFYGRPVDDSGDQTATPFALNNPTICTNLGKLDVLFLINTIPQSNEQRQRIRDTFVKASLFQQFTIAHVFLVGLTSSPNFQGNLDKESKEYGDIAQGEFVDKPETRTLKGLVGFRWVTEFCPMARFVFKLDEDVFVDTDKLLQGLIPAVANVVGDRAMLCFFVQNAPIPRTGPNAFDHNVFPKTSKMRPYCKGFALLTTVNTISSLVEASEHVPLFQFDDLYLYGILPFVAGDIDVYDLGNKRAFHDFGMAVVNCYKDLGDKCPYVATKAFSSRFTSLWDFVSARQASESPNFEGDPSLWNIAAYQSTFDT